MPLLDTTYAQDLLGTFVADLTLQVLSFVAEIERNHILDRQKEGIEAAKLRGVTFGRPEKELPLNHEEILYKWRTGTISARMCSEQLGISRSHLYRKFKKQL